MFHWNVLHVSGAVSCVWKNNSFIRVGLSPQKVTQCYVKLWLYSLYYQMLSLWSCTKAIFSLQAYLIYFWNEWDCPHNTCRVGQCPQWNILMDNEVVCPFRIDITPLFAWLFPNVTLTQRSHPAKKVFSHDDLHTSMCWVQSLSASRYAPHIQLRSLKQS